MLAAVVDPHFEDLTLPRRLADVKAVDDDLVSASSVGLRPDRALGGVLTEGPGVTWPWD
jgi:hypothetical protein